MHMLWWDGPTLCKESLSQSGCKMCTLRYNIWLYYFVWKPTTLKLLNIVRRNNWYKFYYFAFFPFLRFLPFCNWFIFSYKLFTTAGFVLDNTWQHLFFTPVFKVKEFCCMIGPLENCRLCLFTPHFIIVGDSTFLVNESLLGKYCKLHINHKNTSTVKLS